MARKWIGYIGVGSLMCAALGCGILYTRQARLQQTISDKVLRFHVLANSDSEADQALKLAVRDRVLQEYGDLLETCTSKEETLAALKNAQDCKREWLAAALEDGYEIPEPTSDDEYSGQFKLRLPKSLHRALAENSKREGISMNQYCLYLLTKNNAEFRHGA